MTPAAVVGHRSILNSIDNLRGYPWIRERIEAGPRQVLSPDVIRAVDLPCLPAFPVDGPFLLPLERLHELR